jgi:hypothetical protein
MKNITLSIDDGILQAGCEYARSHNISFDKMVIRLNDSYNFRKESESRRGEGI